MAIDKIGQAIKEEITRLEKKIKFYRTLIHSVNGTHKHVAKKTAKPAKKKRTMSKDARERIAAAQRKRWAKQKAGK